MNVKRTTARLGHHFHATMKRRMNDAAEGAATGILYVVIAIAMIAALIPTIVDSVDDANASLYANYPAAASMIRLAPLVLIAGILIWLAKRGSGAGSR